MKDIYKNPLFYYTLVPAIIALWPLLVWTLYLPDAKISLDDDKTQCKKARKIMEDILTIDPERREFADSKPDAAEFDYASAVEKVTSLCRIPSTSYKLSSGIIITSAGQKSQNANVSLKDVDVARFARFLSTIQLRWANLQCVRLKLTKKKGLPDTWNVDVAFKYYY